jgi:hypothetical protein
MQGYVPYILGNRTANRHRYSGRVDQGERVISPQGTRQKSGRKLAIRPAPPLCFYKDGVSKVPRIKSSASESEAHETDNVVSILVLGTNTFL